MKTPSAFARLRARGILRPIYFFLLSVLLLSHLFYIPSSEVHASQASFDGTHDLADCNMIAGWAWDANQPNTPISVDIFDGNTLIATVLANQFRQDLLDAGKGNGAHGFVFPTPDSLKDGATHSIRVRIAGSSIDLTGTPKTINCSPVFQGSFDVANCDFIAGWAWDANQPSAHISVDIYVDSNPFSSIQAPANLFRQDLLDAGIGDGTHGFSFSTPAFLKDGQPHTIRAKFAGTTIELPNSPITINCPASPAPSFEGSFDAANCNTIAGWAWDANQPNTPISVDIYDGSMLIATVLADQFRQDLLDAGKGNGNHGFVFPTPSSLNDGQPHSISVGVAGTTFGLAGNPKTITCPEPEFDGSHDLTSCSGIAGWAWNSNQPNTPISVDIYADDTLICTVLANQFRQDLLDAGKGNGVHGFVFTTPNSLKDGQTHSIKVTFGGTLMNLPNTPQSLNCPVPVFQGTHDVADCDVIAGWVWNANEPNTPISVDIYADGTLIATVLADQFRQDLFDAGKGNGAHGFVFPTPISLKDGNIHSIQVRVAGTFVNLSNTPKTINCLDP
ncbi:MAG TPA: hypothetical protein VNN73_04300 [Blastocatellia bacterium]|nr:hypothetical protein [Blastocatellia bacterium]